MFAVYPYSGDLFEFMLCEIVLNGCIGCGSRCFVGLGMKKWMDLFCS